MKRLHIGSASLLTGDELADAVLDYAAALYESGRTETLGIPFIDEGGERQMARLLITPAMSVWTGTVPRVENEPSDPALVRFLRERSRLLSHLASLDGMTASRLSEPFDL
jgi:hypothetical protein